MTAIKIVPFNKHTNLLTIIKELKQNIAFKCLNNEPVHFSQSNWSYRRHIDVVNVQT